MRTPNPTLRRLVNDSHDVAKVSLTIPAGDVLEVSDDVAAQLVTDGHFKDPALVPESAPQIVKDANGEVDYDATSDEALAAVGLSRPAVDAPPEVPKKAVAAKKASTKKPA